jgi:hypothetical protein
MLTQAVDGELDPLTTSWCDLFEFTYEPEHYRRLLEVKSRNESVKSGCHGVSVKWGCVFVTSAKRYTLHPKPTVTPRLYMPCIIHLTPQSCARAPTRMRTHTHAQHMHTHTHTRT